MLPSDRLLDLRLRQAHLVARSSVLRDQFAQDGLPLQRPFAVADRIGYGMAWLAAHPWWLAALVAIPVVLRPGKVAKTGVKWWGYWRVFQGIRKVIAAL